MGLICSPDYAQEVMENIFQDVKDAEVYIDNIGAFSHSWDDHMALLRNIWNKLQENGFTVNPLKCEWAVKETEWLGYCLTPIGLKPWKKKIEAVLRMQPPTSLKLLWGWGFIGMVNYNRDVWPHRSRILAPLTAKTCAPNTQEGWETSSISMDIRNATGIWPHESNNGRYVLRAYPDHNKPFHIFTDASDYQLGACIMQGGSQWHIAARSLIVHKWITQTSIKDFFVLLQHYTNSIQCCLVLNYMFTQTTKTSSALVTCHSNVFARSPMLMNMDQNYIMWKAHAIRLRILYQGLCAVTWAHP